MTEIQKSHPWLVINDDELSTAALEAKIEGQVQMRRRQSGTITPDFPSFGFVVDMPSPGANPALYYHLRQLNELETAAATPVLAPSPATRLPLLGRLWGLIRQQVHELILFYINRSAARQARLESHLVSLLNEQTRLLQTQQVEIEALKQRVAGLEKTTLKDSGQ
ncbi:MAG: hypothetical protein R6X32_06460 [Chloroflexota bacterium]